MLADVFEHRWEDNPVFHSYYPAKGESRVQYSEGEFVGYRHYDRSETKPLFPFGFGLSYTTLTYSNVSVTPASGSLDQPVTVSFEVKKTGRGEGAEVAEVYVGDPQASIPRPVKELKGFAKVSLKPGEEYASEDPSRSAGVFLLRRREERLECRTGVVQYPDRRFLRQDSTAGHIYSNALICPAATIVPYALIWPVPPKSGRTRVE